MDWDTSRFRVYTTRERSYPHVDLQEARGTLEERVPSAMHVVPRLDCPSHRSRTLWSIGQKSLEPGDAGFELFHVHVRCKCRDVNHVQLPERKLPSIPSGVRNHPERLSTRLGPCVGLFHSAMG